MRLAGPGQQDRRLRAHRHALDLVDQRVLARLAVALALRRRGLQQHAGQETRLDQQEQADLRDVGAGGDVDEIVFRIRIEGVAAGKIAQASIDLREIPGIAEVDDIAAHLRGRRYSFDVADDPSRQGPGVVVVDQLQPVEEQPRLLAKADIGPPSGPAILALAHVERGSQDADGNAAFHAYPNL